MEPTQHHPSETETEARARQRDEIEAELQRRTRELESRNEELVQFASVASHDLRAPLRTIKGFASLLEQELSATSAQQREYLAEIQEGINRMELLITDLLSYTQASSQELTIIPTDLNQIVSLVLKDLQLEIEETTAEIQLDPLPTIMADPIQMRQLYQNLLSNAIKFRRELPLRIHIGRRQTAVDTRFFVADNGIGIDPAQTDRIFDMFQRLHTSADYEGTGIGLAICRKIVERHQGQISVESTPGTGTVFLFSLKS